MYNLIYRAPKMVKQILVYSLFVEIQFGMLAYYFCNIFLYMFI